MVLACYMIIYQSFIITPIVIIFSTFVLSQCLQEKLLIAIITLCTGNREHGIPRVLIAGCQAFLFFLFFPIFQPKFLFFLFFPIFQP